MRHVSQIPDLEVRELSDEGGYGTIKIGHVMLRVVFSWGMGWDHVSVSLPNRCPRWEEMESVKRRFFQPQEVAMQLHVAKSNHISHHPYCLHIWRPQNVEIPLPPKELV